MSVYGTANERDARKTVRISTFRDRSSYTIRYEPWMTSRTEGVGQLRNRSTGFRKSAQPINGSYQSSHDQIRVAG